MIGPRRSRLIEAAVCPSCREPLRPEGEDALLCGGEQTIYGRDGGIWRLLDSVGRVAADQFLPHYRTVRSAEAWGAPDDAYYRALPFEDLSGRHTEIWRLRAVSYRAMTQRVLRQPAGAEARTILDLGAGNGWLSYRLAKAGHRVAAIDISDDPRDGLGAHTHYGAPAPFDTVQASFDRLPWPDGFADLVVYNGSFHYSADYSTTLREGRRVLAEGGAVVIIDSPFYRRAASGEDMLRERDADFRAEYGIVANSSAQEGFLTRSRLHALGREMDIRWRVVTPFYGFRWVVRPLANRLRGLREPVRFHVVVGRVSAGRHAP